MKKINFETVIRFTTALLLSFAIAMLFSCNQYTCPTNTGREPRDKTKRMKVHYKKINDTLYLVREEAGFNVKTYYTNCNPCKP